MKKIFYFVVVIVAFIFLVWWFEPREIVVVTNFNECVKTGNLVMESYPRQCQYQGETFTEFIGNELEKIDLVRLDNPRPNQIITSPLVIRGEARGYWFFEADFPVVLTDWDGRIIAQGIASAVLDPNDPESTWMTEDFVPFEAKLTFRVEKDVYSKKGTLILQKNNPSGLSEHDDALEIPVVFE